MNFMNSMNGSSKTGGSGVSGNSGMDEESFSEKQMAELRHEKTEV